MDSRRCFPFLIIFLWMRVPWGSLEENRFLIALALGILLISGWPAPPVQGLCHALVRGLLGSNVVVKAHPSRRTPLASSSRRSTNTHSTHDQLLKAIPISTHSSWRDHVTSRGTRYLYGVNTRVPDHPYRGGTLTGSARTGNRRAGRAHRCGHLEAAPTRTTSSCCAGLTTGPYTKADSESKAVLLAP